MSFTLSPNGQNNIPLVITIGELSSLKHAFPVETSSDKVERAGKVASRVVTHLQNFATSFVLSASDISNAISSGQSTMNDEFVPLKSFDRWLNSLSKRLENDPDFK